MLRKKVAIFSALMLVASGVSSYAQLSTNPWAQANEEEDIAEVYEKRQRRGRVGNIQHYQAEETVTIDRTHAYIQDEEEQTEGSFLDKMKNVVSSPKKEETPLIPNTKDNRQALAKQKQMQEAEKVDEKSENDSLLPSFGLSKNISSLKNSLKLPNMNATKVIQKFERSSGINLKSIGRKMKGK